MDLLEKAREELDIGERNIENADMTYDRVEVPGKPFLKFAEGNNYLRAAKVNLISANGYLNQAYRAMVR